MQKGFLAEEVRREKITRTQISCHDKRQWRRKVCWVCVIFHSLMNYGGHERRSHPLLPLFTRRPSPLFCQGLGGTDSNKSVENLMIYRSFELFTVLSWMEKLWPSKCFTTIEWKLLLKSKQSTLYHPAFWGNALATLHSLL